MNARRYMFAAVTAAFAACLGTLSAQAEAPTPPDTQWNLSGTTLTETGIPDGQTAWVFTLNSGTLTVKTTGASKALNFRSNPTIASKIKRIGPTSGSAGFMKENANIEEVYLPATVTTFSLYAFYKCTALRICDLPEDSALATIGADSVKNCTALTEFRVTENLKTIVASTSNNGSLFGCTKMRLVGPTLPNSLTTIKGQFLSGSPNAIVGRLTLGGDDVSDLAVSSSKEAFKNDTGITEVVFGAGVTRFASSSAFTGCTGITNIVCRNPGGFNFGTYFASLSNIKQYDFYGWPTGTLVTASAKTRILAPRDNLDWLDLVADNAVFTKWADLSASVKQVYWDNFGETALVPEGQLTAATTGDTIIPKGTWVVFNKGKAIDIKRFVVEEIPVQYLSGAACEPKVTVRDYNTGAVLTQGKDYTVEYLDNTVSGTATAKVTGLGDYAVTRLKTKEVAFTICEVLRVRADATGTGGTWADAMNWTNALLTAKTSAVPCEIWVAGDVTATNDTAYAFAKLLAIRGGFAGTEKDPSGRPAGVRSVVDGLDKYNCLDFSNTGAMTLDSLYFTRGYHHGVRKTSSTGDLAVTNCAFNGNGSIGGSWSYNAASTGTNPSMNAIGGGGANFIGKDGAKLTVINCDFSGNTTKPGCNNYYCGWGGGACIANFAQARIDGCTFVTNHPGVGKNYRMGYSSALQLIGTPTRVTGCAFRGNAAPMPNGCVVNAYGACGGTVFENCLFTGNINGKYYTSAHNGAGEICFELSSATTKAAVTNCTFAYNYARKSATVTVKKGDVDVHNTIFWANVSESSTSVGTEINCTSDGTVSADWILIGGTDAAYVTAADPQTLTLGENILTCDPLLVTPTADYTNLMKVATMPYTGWTAKALDGLAFDPSRAAYNVHLRGRYVDELTGVAVKVGKGSPAVDAGDPADDCTNEPQPNGKRINLGCYGNTPWATTSKMQAFLLFVK